MPLSSLIYVSRMTEECQMEELQEILKVSRKKNAEANITGLLCYDPTYFLQYLEGPGDAISNLYETILNDSRHTDVLKLDKREIFDRVFGKWRMAFLRATDLEVELLKRFTTGKKFDPYALSPDQAWDLFCALADRAFE